MSERRPPNTRSERPSEVERRRAAFNAAVEELQARGAVEATAHDVAAASGGAISVVGAGKFLAAARFEQLRPWRKSKGRKTPPVWRIL